MPPAAQERVRAQSTAFSGSRWRRGRDWCRILGTKQGCVPDAGALGCSSAAVLLSSGAGAPRSGEGHISAPGTPLRRPVLASGSSGGSGAWSHEAFPGRPAVACVKVSHALTLVGLCSDGYCASCVGGLERRPPRRSRPPRRRAGSRSASHRAARRRRSSRRQGSHR